ncbi:hypothetical protein UFOVP1290_240 [uncultured Caudovirales phage]|uniref:Uncharacterized protein n=1 Tax=uncultured Caudovirales phage TaxID=2100421 RepID=A0A6J5RGP1_9CAUD|nr:hypothetical protein UFOVP1290_240 [uncultured Caudovirales phage]
MSEITALIREYPSGSLFLMLCFLVVVERIVVTALNKNKTIIQHNCDCSGHDYEDDEEDE